MMVTGGTAAIGVFRIGRRIVMVSVVLRRGRGRVERGLLF
jgi:hypothetical protein